MSNDLLKRLSRTVDTNFCGRILILLAKSLPLTEKSGLNLISQFNTANTTIYEEEKVGAYLIFGYRFAMLGNHGVFFSTF